MPQSLPNQAYRTFHCLRCTPKAPYRRAIGPPISLLRRHAYSTKLLPTRAHVRTKTLYVAPISGIIVALVAGWAVTNWSSPRRLDASPSQQGDALTSGAKVQITGRGQDEDVAKVATGTSTVPYFPKSIWLPRAQETNDEGRSAALPAGIGAAGKEEEYQLLGLGVRKVSLFKIEVYVVGLYVAKSDIGRLQEELVKTSVGNLASTLVQGEKEDLRKTLLDGKGSERVWSEVLKQGGVRSAVRIVPVKNTNFSHLRDGWIRGIEARGRGPEFDDDGFKASVGDFKAMMGGKGAVGKGRVLLLGRGQDGTLRAWVEEDAAIAVQGANGRLLERADRISFLGTVKDERLSRLVWMGYISGDSPASEEARRSVVEGVIDIVERPIGTVETQVV
ncbi:MAG: hypothetical protein Q9163_004128 [Psora crenata]